MAKQEKRQLLGGAVGASAVVHLAGGLSGDPRARLPLVQAAKPAAFDGRVRK